MHYEVSEGERCPTCGEGWLTAATLMDSFSGYYTCTNPDCRAQGTSGKEPEEIKPVTQYIVINMAEREHNRFSSNSEVVEHLEIMLNDHGYILDDFMVIKADNYDILSLDESKQIKVSVGGR